MDSNENMKKCFNKKLEELIKTKSENCGFMTIEKYNQLKNIISELKNKQQGRTPVDNQRLKRYDLIKVGGLDKLIYPISESKEFIRFYITNDEMFDILHTTHQSISHGGKRRMMIQLQKNYKNITSEAIMLYINLCETCQKRPKVAKRPLVSKSFPCNKINLKENGQESHQQNTVNEINCRCQVDIIDMQPDKGFQFVLIYKHNQTNFVQLRPLKTKDSDEVVSLLLDLFTIFGAPNVIQSDLGREFAQNLVEQLSLKWNELKIVHGKSFGSLEKTNEEITKMLNTWLDINLFCTWTEGLRFVQLMKNMSYDERIGCTPFEAMFGAQIKIGLKSCLPDEVIKNLKSEEELEKVVNKI